MQTAVYLRQSEDRDGNELAVTRQREDCLDLCERKGWDDIVEYVDNSRSATNGVRPAYRDMLRDIRGGMISAVVVWDLDRLHRQPIELEEFINLADEKRLALATVGGETDLSTDNGRLFARIKGAVARAEVDRKSARQKRQARQQAEQGGGWGGRRAYGYTMSENKIIAEEAKFIRRAYKSVLAGESLNSIAVQMNKDGARTTLGNPWSGTTLRLMLINPRYVSKRAYKGEIVADAVWKPIVTTDVWQPVRDILTDERRRRDRPAGRKYLLTSILRCGLCDDGTTMGTGYSNGNAIYKCKRCQRLSRRIEPIEKLVAGLAVGYLSRSDALNLLIDSERVDVEALRQRERALMDELEQLAADRYDPDVDLSASQFRAANQRLQEKLAEVRDSMRDSNRARIFDGLEKAHAKSAVREWWDGLPLDRQRAIVDTILVVTLLPMGRGVAFKRDHLRLQWVTGDD